MSKIDWLDWQMEQGLDSTFQKIDTLRDRYGLKPSDVERELALYWDLGDYWREWWEESGEEYE